jgi:hypothetical protein
MKQSRTRMIQTQPPHSQAEKNLKNSRIIYSAHSAQIIKLKSNQKCYLLQGLEQIILLVTKSRIIVSVHTQTILNQ